jgi:hypothetical protein
MLDLLKSNIFPTYIYINKMANKQLSFQVNYEVVLAKIITSQILIASDSSSSSSSSPSHTAKRRQQQERREQTTRTRYFHNCQICAFKKQMSKQHFRILAKGTLCQKFEYF